MTLFYNNKKIKIIEVWYCGFGGKKFTSPFVTIQSDDGFKQYIEFYKIETDTHIDEIYKALLATEKKFDGDMSSFYETLSLFKVK